MHEAGGIEQDVDLADRLAMAVDGGAVAHVEPRHFGHAFLRERRKPFSSISVAKTVAPSRAKAMRAGAADPGRSRGHECALALQAV